MKTTWSMGLLLVMLVLTGCGGGGGSGDDDDGPTNPPPNMNAAPVAEAGNDQNVKQGSAVTLDGSASSDADGDLLTYHWSLSRPSGSSASLNDPGSVTPSFVADVAGDYVVQLVVNDGTADSALDKVTVTATTTTVNSAPIANAGPDQNVKTGLLVTLDGTGSNDPDGNNLTYGWTLVSGPDGNNASLVNKLKPKPAFTPDVGGDYVVALVVNDGIVDSAPDRVTITATPPSTNSAPVADAGHDQTVFTGDTVTLDGNNSSDSDIGDTLSYAWTLVSKPTGSAASLAAANTVSPSFVVDLAGDYVVQVEVSDGQGGVDSDNVVVNTSPIVLRRLDRDSGNYEAVALPYNATWNIVVGGGLPEVTLDHFQLEAKGQAYTIRNVKIVYGRPQGSPTISAGFGGLSDGDTVNAGGTVNFELTTSNNGVGGGYTLIFVFEIAGTGQAFFVTYHLVFI